MECEIKVTKRFVARFMKVNNNQIWAAADLYEEYNFEDGPIEGFASDWHDTLGEALQCLCERLEVEINKEAALEFVHGVGTKLMFDELPRWVLAFAFKDIE